MWLAGTRMECTLQLNRAPSPSVSFPSCSCSLTLLCRLQVKLFHMTPNKAPCNLFKVKDLRKSSQAVTHSISCYHISKYLKLDSSQKIKQTAYVVEQACYCLEATGPGQVAEWPDKYFRREASQRKPKIWLTSQHHEVQSSQSNTESDVAWRVC